MFAAMKNLGHEATRDLLLLSIVAGSADAAGFMGLGHVFTSNMTGNLVLLGIACGQGQWYDAGKTFYVLAFFCIGAFLGSRLARYFPDSAWQKLMKRLLVVEMILVLAFATGWTFTSETGRPVQFYWLAPLLVLAMGLQSAAMNRLAIAGVMNTAMTGTLTSFAAGLGSLWCQSSTAAFEMRRRLSKQLMVILLYCGGAAAGGIIILHASWAAGLLPAFCLLLVLIAHLKN
jgi:uncharacterized membrane protein YoaK (UPF0700 family)